MTAVLNDTRDASPRSVQELLYKVLVVGEFGVGEYFLLGQR
jgi:hypothetical protein